MIDTAAGPIIAESLAGLCEDPVVRPDYDEVYVRLQKYVTHLEVTNDATERGVKKEVADIFRNERHIKK